MLSWPGPAVNWKEYIKLFRSEAAVPVIEIESEPVAFGSTIHVIGSGTGSVSLAWTYTAARVRLSAANEKNDTLSFPDRFFVQIIFQAF
jgi:hypothetical protein